MTLLFSRGRNDTRLTFNHLKTFLCTLFVLIVTDVAKAQVGVGANFGIEAELYSGDTGSGFGTDDWFSNGLSGAGVIDEATALSMGYQAQLAAENNIAFDLKQSLPNFFSNNGYLWYSTRYARDYTNDSGLDLTTFNSGKNGDNPTASWGTSSGPLPSKTDIVDFAVHMRRNGVSTTDDLWVDLMISTLSSEGSHFVDFELFVSEIENAGGGFTNSGVQEGHTAWTFAPDGSVTTIGDMIIGFSFTGGGVSGVEVRLWVDRTVFNSGTSPGGTSSFVWGADIVGGSTYGYGSIVVPTGALLTHVNTTAVSAPPWGTTNTSGYTSSYSPGYLAEVGINFRHLGFDPELLFGIGAACDSPFSSVLTKSRTSSSFTSTLKDFSGPLDFLGSAAQSEVNTSIANAATVAPFDSCLASETRTLTAEFNSPDAEYVWYSLTPGVVFPANGLSEISGVAMYDVSIDTPGQYELGIAPLPGCFIVTDSNDIILVPAKPCAVNDYFVLVENNPSIVLSVLNNDFDLESDLNAVSLNNSTLLQPSHGILSINSGVLTYQPNTAYVGSDTFEYQICDTNDPALCDIATVTVNMQVDTDDDGISDYSDLDDDNDGILDTDEGCFTESVDFSINQSSVSLSLNNGSDGFVLDLTSLDNGFNMSINGNQLTSQEIEFHSPIRTAEFADGTFYGGGGVPNIWSIAWNNPTNPETPLIRLIVKTDGSVELYGSKTHNGPLEPMVFVNGLTVNPVSWNAGTNTIILDQVINGNTVMTGRLSSLVQECPLDTDGDGIVDSIDLDSDNDGIYDVVEAGHNQAHLNGVLLATFGPNGLGDTVETSPESGTINFTILNSDGADSANYLDGDSDNDGCSDANEAYANANADGGDNEYYDLGAPPVTDSEGRVTTAAYTIPSDIGANGTQDYLENTLPVIGIQPLNTTLCPGCSTTLTVSATNADTFQWQFFNGMIWVDLTNSGIYSGTTTENLSITNASVVDEGNQYRLLISSDNYICGQIISNNATLIIRVNTIITNRRITYRVKKN